MFVCPFRPFRPETQICCPLGVPAVLSAFPLRYYFVADLVMQERKHLVTATLVSHPQRMACYVTLFPPGVEVKISTQD